MKELNLDRNEIVAIGDNVNDKEMIEDMLVVALNDAFKQIDKVTEQKMGKYSSMMPGGLF